MIKTSQSHPIATTQNVLGYLSVVLTDVANKTTAIPGYHGDARVITTFHPAPYFSNPNSQSHGHGGAVLSNSTVGEQTTLNETRSSLSTISVSTASTDVISDAVNVPVGSGVVGSNASTMGTGTVNAFNSPVRATKSNSNIVNPLKTPSPRPLHQPKFNPMMNHTNNFQDSPSPKTPLQQTHSLSVNDGHPPLESTGINSKQPIPALTPEDCLNLTRKTLISIQKFWDNEAPVQHAAWKHRASFDAFVDVVTATAATGNGVNEDKVNNAPPHTLPIEVDPELAELMMSSLERGKRKKKIGEEDHRMIRGVEQDFEKMSLPDIEEIEMGMGTTESDSVVGNGSVERVMDVIRRQPLMLPVLAIDIRDWDSYRLLLRRYASSLPAVVAIEDNVPGGVKFGGNWEGRDVEVQVTIGNQSETQTTGTQTIPDRWSHSESIILGKGSSTFGKTTRRSSAGSSIALRVRQSQQLQQLINMNQNPASGTTTSFTDGTTTASELSSPTSNTIEIQQSAESRSARSSYIDPYPQSFTAYAPRRLSEISLRRFELERGEFADVGDSGDRISGASRLGASRQRSKSVSSSPHEEFERLRKVLEGVGINVPVDVARRDDDTATDDTIVRRGKGRGSSGIDDGASDSHKACAVTPTLRNSVLTVKSLNDLPPSTNGNAGNIIPVARPANLVISTSRLDFSKRKPVASTTESPSPAPTPCTVTREVPSPPRDSLVKPTTQNAPSSIRMSLTMEDSDPATSTILSTPPRSTKQQQHSVDGGNTPTASNVYANAINNNVTTTAKTPSPRTTNTNNASTNTTTTPDMDKDSTRDARRQGHRRMQSTPELSTPKNAVSPAATPPAATVVSDSSFRRSQPAPVTTTTAAGVSVPEKRSLKINTTTSITDRGPLWSPSINPTHKPLPLNPIPPMSLQIPAFGPGGNSASATGGLHNTATSDAPLSSTVGPNTKPGSTLGGLVVVPGNNNSSSVTTPRPISPSFDSDSLYGLYGLEDTQATLGSVKSRHRVPGGLNPSISYENLKAANANGGDTASLLTIGGSGAGAGKIGNRSWISGNGGNGGIGTSSGSAVGNTSTGGVGVTVGGIVGAITNTTDVASLYDFAAFGFDDTLQSRKTTTIDPDAVSVVGKGSIINTTTHGNNTTSTSSTVGGKIFGSGVVGSSFAGKTLGRESVTSISTISNVNTTEGNGIGVLASSGSSVASQAGTIPSQPGVGNNSSNLGNNTNNSGQSSHPKLRRPSSWKDLWKAPGGFALAVNTRDLGNVGKGGVVGSSYSRGNTTGTTTTTTTNGPNHERSGAAATPFFDRFSPKSPSSPPTAGSNSAADKFFSGMMAGMGGGDRVVGVSNTSVMDGTTSNSNSTSSPDDTNTKRRGRSASFSKAFGVSLGSGRSESRDKHSSTNGSESSVLKKLHSLSDAAFNGSRNSVINANKNAANDNGNTLTINILGGGNNNNNNTFSKSPSSNPSTPILTSVDQQQQKQERVFAVARQPSSSSISTPTSSSPPLLFFSMAGSSNANKDNNGNENNSGGGKSGVSNISRSLSIRKDKDGHGQGSIGKAWGSLVAGMRMGSNAGSVAAGSGGGGGDGQATSS
ncbi:hypothetical protein HDU76_003370 [Blyttiomyces sp. JEL0837]|nr:hypothetical protein HDU76_003370 [Blyttiomyces sp. JEL0837]